MLISIILPTKNNERTLPKLLDSACKQSYTNFEIIHVDNFSTDATWDIVTSYADKLPIQQYRKWPERHIQRPYGYKQCSWDIIYFIDSDMYMTPWLLQEIVNTVSEPRSPQVLIVPEKNVWWRYYRTKVKAYERSFYQGNIDMEAARVFTRDVYEIVGWRNTDLIAAEDRELTDRTRKKWYNIGHLQDNFIWHDEGEISLIALCKKKYYYGTKMHGYFASWSTQENTQTPSLKQKIITYTKTFSRKFFDQPKKLIYLPGLIIMLSCSFICMMWGMNMGRKI